jgi:hypothetical protein
VFAAIALLVLATIGEPLASPGALVETLPAGVRVSGFGDFISTNANDDAGSFRVGQAEVDLEAALGRSASVSMAIAYDGEAVTLATFVVGDERSVTRRFGVESIGVWAGRFDVPFGIDYHCYASADRRLVTTPEIVARTHGCWNDVGVQANIGAARWNVTAFATNGEVADDADMAAGGRVGIVVASGLDVGASVAAVGVREGGDETLVGLDMRAQVHRLKLKGEYISRSRAGANTGVDGFYVGAELDFGRWFVIERYGGVTDEFDATSIRQASSGLGFVLNESIEARLEHRVRRQDSPELFAQLVVTF